MRRWHMSPGRCGGVWAEQSLRASLRRDGADPRVVERSRATGLALGLTPSGALALRAAPDADPLDPAARFEDRGGLCPGRRARAPAPRRGGGGHAAAAGHRVLARSGPRLRHAALRDAGARGEPQAPARPVSRSRDPGARRGRAADGGRRIPGHRRARRVLGGDERGVPRRAGRVRRAAGGVSALAARRLARGGPRALPPRGEPRRSRRAVRVPRDLQHASRPGRARHSTVRSARRSASTRARGTAPSSWPCSSPCRSRRRGVPCCASWWTRATCIGRSA